jgi:peptidoglycan/LPS O-acetylase OafA/YrhL
MFEICSVVIIAAFLLTGFLFCDFIIPKEVQNMHSKYRNIDGIRGFLAFGVFIHHAIFYYFYLQTGIWGGSKYRFYNLSGQFSVSIFFMITGFLFWQKVIMQNGKIEYQKLIKSRITRIAPMYFFAIFVTFIIGLCCSNFKLHTSFLQTSKNIISWLFLGIQTIIPYNINNIDLVPLAPPIWTLHYEWLFYLTLPITALFYRFINKITMLFVLFILQILTMKIHFRFEMIFISGIICAHLSLNDKIYQYLKSSKLLEIAGIFSFLLSMFFLGGYYDYKATIFGTIFFIYLVNSDSKILKFLLQNKASKALGLSSYSIYMLHQPIMYTMGYILTKYIPISHISIYQWLIFMSLMGTVIALVSMVTFFFIEYRFIKKR